MATSQPPATAEGHEIIASCQAGASLVFITRQLNRATGNDAYVVNVAHTATHYVTWSLHDTEPQARESANRAWRRYSGRETMICA